MELSREYGAGPISLKKIAQKNKLSEQYLEQLISPLRNSGLVRSVRGAYGGYVLTQEPQQVTAGDVIRVLEGPISLVEFDKEDDPAKRDLWVRIRNSISDILDSTTLNDLIQFKDDKQEDNYMFYI